MARKSIEQLEEIIYLNKFALSWAKDHKLPEFAMVALEDLHKAQKELANRHQRKRKAI